MYTIKNRDDVNRNKAVGRIVSWLFAAGLYVLAYYILRDNAVVFFAIALMIWADNIFARIKGR